MADTEEKSYLEQLTEMWSEDSWLIDSINEENRKREAADSTSYIDEVLKTLQPNTSDPASMIAKSMQPSRSGVDYQGAQYNTALFNKVGGTIGGYLKKIFSAEANNNRFSVNRQPGQTASGPYQFIAKTWRGMCRKYGLNYTLNDRFDMEKATHVMQLFTEENRRGLAKFLRREPTHAELYAAHFLGLGGALKFLSRRDDEPMTNVIDMYTINKNKWYCRQRVGKSWGRVNTVGEVKQILGRKMA